MPDPQTTQTSVQNELIELIKNSDSLNESDRQYWLAAIPTMTAEQMERLRQKEGFTVKKGTKKIYVGSVGVLVLLMTVFFSVRWGGLQNNDLLTSTVTTTSSVFSVRDYGAKGDGVTDDSAAFLQGINSLPASGGTLFVPAGRYLITSEIQINRDNVTIMGVGNESVITIKKGPYNTVFKVPGLGADGNGTQVVHNITFSRLEFDGAKVPGEWDTGPHYGKGFWAIWITQAENVTISEVDFKDWASEAFTFSNGNKSNRTALVEKVHISGSGRNGFHFGQGYDLTGRLMHVEDSPSQQWGIGAGNGLDQEVEGVEAIVDHSIVEDSIFERENTGTAGAGIALQSAYGPFTNGIVQRNLIRDHVGPVGVMGVWDGAVSRIRNVTIQDNWFLDDEKISAWRNMLDIRSVDGLVAKNNVMNEYVHVDYKPLPAAKITNSHNITLDNNRMYWPNCPFSLKENSQQITLTNNVYSANTCSMDTDNTTQGLTQTNNTTVDDGSVDRIAPTVSLSVQNAQNFSGATNPIQVRAVDSGVGVDRIMYFIDGIPQGVIDADAGSFNFDATRYQNGPHMISARVWDKNANVAPMFTVKVMVAGNADTTVPEIVPGVDSTPSPSPAATSTPNSTSTPNPTNPWATPTIVPTSTPTSYPTPTAPYQTSTPAPTFVPTPTPTNASWYDVRSWFGSASSSTPAPKNNRDAQCTSVRGDVNCDKTVDSKDAQLILDVLIGNSQINAQQRRNADINCNTQVNFSDLNALVLYLRRGKNVAIQCPK